MHKRLQVGRREVKEVSFDPNPVILKKDYLDVFEGIRARVISTAKYDENHDAGTISLGTSRMERQDELNAEHKKI